MTIRPATQSDRTLSNVERSKLSHEHLARAIERHDTGEPLYDRRQIEAAGLLCEPFWDTPDDVEGECYLPYIAAHPEFTLALRRGALERLVRAQELLPADWQIVVKAGYRPHSVQLAVLDSFMHESRMRNPGWSDDEHLAHARTFVADPRIVCPAHVTGGAVDVDVRRRGTADYIDMGCPPNTDNEISFLHSDRLTPAQYSNRMTLLGAMLAADFAPNPHEWWHYQYGETYWAAFYGHDKTIYNLLNPDY